MRDIEAVWRRLEAKADNSFFTSWAWIGAWLTALPERIRPLLLVAKAEGAVIGAAILVERERQRPLGKARELYFNATGQPEFDGITIEHNGFLAARDWECALWPAFLRWFAEQTDFDELAVPGIRWGVIVPHAIPAGLLRHRTLSSAHACMLPHEGRREAILDSLSSNARQQLRRNLRAAQSRGSLLCERARTVEVALAWFGALKQFHIESWTQRGQQHAFRSPFFEACHRNVIALGVPEESVDLLRISANGAPLGYLYNFRTRNRAIAYQSGFAHSERPFRPGYISHLLAMEFAARTGAERYDFLAGDNQLKRTFANEAYAMACWRFARPSLHAKIKFAARGALQKMRG